MSSSESMIVNVSQFLQNGQQGENQKIKKPSLTEHEKHVVLFEECERKFKLMVTSFGREKIIWVCEKLLMKELRYKNISMKARNR